MRRGMYYCEIWFNAFNENNKKDLHKIEDLPEGVLDPCLLFLPEDPIVRFLLSRLLNPFINVNKR